MDSLFGCASGAKSKRRILMALVRWESLRAPSSQPSWQQSWITPRYLLRKQLTVNQALLSNDIHVYMRVGEI